VKTLNRVSLIGHLGQTPEMRETDSGAKFLPASVATNLVVPQKEGEPKTYTEWHRVLFWNQLAELAVQMLKKGTPVFVEGRLRTYKKHDAEAGVDRWNTVIVATNFIVLSKREEQPEVPPEQVADAAEVPF